MSGTIYIKIFIGVWFPFWTIQTMIFWQRTNTFAKCEWCEGVLCQNADFIQMHQLLPAQSRPNYAYIGRGIRPSSEKESYEITIETGVEDYIQNRAKMQMMSSYCCILKLWDFDNVIVFSGLWWIQKQAKNQNCSPKTILLCKDPCYYSGALLSTIVLIPVPMKPFTVFWFQPRSYVRSYAMAS